MDLNIRTAIGDDGVLVARIDMPGRAMNVFSLDMMDSLECLLDHVDGNDGVRAVVIASGKPTFLVGADLDMIRMFAEVAVTGSDDSLHALFGRLGRLFRRLEKSLKPYVAAINGLALGGGLEVALACHERVAADDKAVQLGLPEIKLGLLPGAGGTQRLPRLIGAGEAMRMLLGGDPVSAARALELGLVQALAAPDQLIETARRRALALTAPRAPWDVPGRSFDAAPFDFSKPDAFDDIAAATAVTARQRARYPAYDAIMQCVTGGWNRPMDEACHREMDVFVGLMRDPVAGNMVRTLFLNRQRAAREGQPPQSLSDARVAVVGRDTAALRALLEKGRAPLIEAAALTGQDIAVVVGDAAPVSGTPVAWLRGADGSNTAARPSAGIWLSDASAHGRAAEVVVQAGDEKSADAGRKLAHWLRATVLVTGGRASLLAALRDAQTAARAAACSEDEENLAVALAAARAWLDGGIADVELADVAAVLSGLHPAYSGGPYTYLRQMGRDRTAAQAADAAQRQPALFDFPAGAEDLFKPPGGGDR